MNARADGTPRGRAAALPLALLGIAVACHAVAFLGLPFIPANDSVWYLNLTYSLSQSGPFDVYAGGEPRVPDVHYPPGYPFFLELCLRLFGAEHFVAGALLLQHAMGIGSALLIFRLGSLLGHRVAGFLAGLAYCLYFPSVFDCQMLLSEPLFIFFNLLSLALLCGWLTAPAGGGRLVAAGVLLGLCVTIRPVAALQLPVFAGLAWMRSDAARVRSAALLMAPVFALLLAAWLWNGLHFGRFALSNSAGAHLINRVWGFDERVFPDEPNTRRILRAAEQSGVPFDVPGLWWDFLYAFRAGSGLTAAEADRVLLAAALATIAREPVAYLEGSARGVLRILNDPDVWRQPVDWMIHPGSYRAFVRAFATRVPGRPLPHLPDSHFEANQEFLAYLNVRGRARELASWSTPWARAVWAWDRSLPTYAGGACTVGLILLVGLAWVDRRRGGLLLGSSLALLVSAALFEYPVTRYREPLVPLLLLATALVVASVRAGPGRPRSR